MASDQVEGSPDAVGPGLRAELGAELRAELGAELGGTGADLSPGSAVVDCLLASRTEALRHVA